MQLFIMSAMWLFNAGVKAEPMVLKTWISLQRRSILIFLDSCQKAINSLMMKIPINSLQKWEQKLSYDSSGLIWMNLSYDLRHKANTETSQQRKNEALNASGC
jgi:DNA-directed RNA polymerase subunit beta'